LKEKQNSGGSKPSLEGEAEQLKGRLKAGYHDKSVKIGAIFEP
jgi:hypothetical protein